MVRRSLDWISQAPIAIEGRGSTSASPEAVFAILADHERWPEWFPAVKQVEVLGAASGVGATRRVRIPGAVVDEEFIAWEEGVRWSFTGTGAKPGFLRSLVEDCRISVVGGRTEVSYTMYMEPKGLLKPMLKVGAAPMRANLTKAMRNLAERAERA
jgi:carbon monoxide dehydrogenase subunit G